MRLLIAGGTGFIGRTLTTRARKLGHEVTITSRTPSGEPDQLAWDTCSPLELPRVDAVVTLAGEPIAGGRWTAARREAMVRSRVESTRHLVTSLASMAGPDRPRVLVGASAVGWYGDRGDEVLTEDAGPGEGFLAELCRSWEAAAAAATELGVRVVHLRIGMVLGRGGGALAAMLRPFRLCMGGPLGSGRQWVPWVHELDLARLLCLALEHPDLRGPLNGTAPEPVTNRELTRALGAALHRPAVLRVPGCLLRLGLGEMATVLLASQRVVPALALAAGFTFRFPTLRGALADLLGDSRE
jgi:uncharacterized protein (TIGR01777 family)